MWLIIFDLDRNEDEGEVDLERGESYRFKALNMKISVIYHIQAHEKPNRKNETNGT